MAKDIDEHNEPLLAGLSSLSEEAPSRNTPPSTKKKAYDASFTGQHMQKGIATEKPEENLV